MLSYVSSKPHRQTSCFSHSEKSKHLKAEHLGIRSQTHRLVGMWSKEARPLIALTSSVLT